MKFIFLSLLFVSSAVFGQTNTKVDLKKLDSYYSEMVKEWDAPGLTIGIVKDGKLIFTGAYGVLEEGGKDEPDENSLYAIASNSKAFTSAIIGMLVDEGKLNWNDKVKDHLPYFEVYDSWVSSEVTIRDLLSHRVGLGTYSGDFIWYKSDLSSEQIIKRAKHLPQAFKYRAGYGYSNLMYITAGELIKKVTGKSWSANVKERILKPLGMDRTITSINDLKSKGNFATPHARQEGKNIPIVWEDWEEIGALGGLISSVKDLSKWMIFNLNHGVWGSERLLSKNSRNNIWMMHNSYYVDHTSEDDKSTHFKGYGLGWGLRDYHGRLLVSHTGGYDGMLTALTLVPDENLGIVVLTNGMKSPFKAAMNYALDQFLEVGDKDWSESMLKNRSNEEDERVVFRKKRRVENTKPSISKARCAGTYKSKIYGEIKVFKIGDDLRLEFEHSDALSATLKHWHYDVWEIKWDVPHAWFNFGTVKFVTNNNLEIKGLDFDVPNDDIFFEELKPYRVD